MQKTKNERDGAAEQDRRVVSVCTVQDHILYKYTVYNVQYKRYSTVLYVYTSIYKFIYLIRFAAAVICHQWRHKGTLQVLYLQSDTGSVQRPPDGGKRHC
jgi:hypothetical protein